MAKITKSAFGIYADKEGMLSSGQSQMLQEEKASIMHRKVMDRGRAYPTCTLEQFIEDAKERNFTVTEDGIIKFFLAPPTEKQHPPLFSKYVRGKLYSRDATGRTQLLMPIDELYCEALNSVEEMEGCTLGQFEDDARKHGYNMNEKGEIEIYYVSAPRARSHDPLEEIDWTQYGRLIEISGDFYMSMGDYRWMKLPDRRATERYSEAARTNCPLFTGATLIPAHGSRYVQYRDSSFNFYPYIAAIEHAEGGETPAIDGMIKHIFGESRDEFRSGLEYLRMLWQHPGHSLPILSLCSKEQGTGKTSFAAEFLARLFCDEVVMVADASVLSEGFNDYYTKLVCAFEEVHSVGTVAEKLKAMATAGKVTVNEKYEKPKTINTYCHIIILTNNDTAFANIPKEDTRYWIRSIPSLSKKEDHDQFWAKVEAEIPAFRWRLEKMEPWDNEEWVDRGRLWFKMDRLRTEAWTIVMENSKSPVEIAIEEALEELRDRGYAHFTIKGLSTLMPGNFHSTLVAEKLRSAGCIYGKHRGIKFSDENEQIRKFSRDGQKQHTTVSTMWRAPWYDEANVIAEEIVKDSEEAVELPF